MSNRRTTLILIGVGIIIGGFVSTLIGLTLANTAVGKHWSWLNVVTLILDMAMIVYVFKNLPASRE